MVRIPMYGRGLAETALATVVCAAERYPGKKAKRPIHCKVPLVLPLPAMVPVCQEPANIEHVPVHSIELGKPACHSVFPCSRTNSESGDSSRRKATAIAFIQYLPWTWYVLLRTPTVLEHVLTDIVVRS